MNKELNFISVEGLTVWIGSLKSIAGLYAKDVETGKCYLIQEIDEAPNKQDDPENYCGAV